MSIADPIFDQCKSDLYEMIRDLTIKLKNKMQDLTSKITVYTEGLESNIRSLDDANIFSKKIASLIEKGKSDLDWTQGNYTNCFNTWKEYYDSFIIDICSDDDNGAETPTVDKELINLQNNSNDNVSLSSHMVSKTSEDLILPKDGCKKEITTTLNSMTAVKECIDLGDDEICLVENEFDKNITTKSQNGSSPTSSFSSKISSTNKKGTDRIFLTDKGRSELNKCHVIIQKLPDANEPVKETEETRLKRLCNLDYIERGNNKRENSSSVTSPKNNKRLKIQKTTSDDAISTDNSADESSDDQDPDEEQFKDCTAVKSNSPESEQESYFSATENSSDFNCSEAESADEVQEKRKKKINKKDKKYKRIRKTEKCESSSESQLDLSDKEVLKFKVNAAENHEKNLSLDVGEPLPHLITDSELVKEHPNRNGDGPIKKTGRKDIRRVLDESEISVNSRLARQEEEKRTKRLRERNEKLESLLGSSYRLENMILDYDVNQKKELLKVDSGLVKHLKKHQKEGVIFMWDACFESLDLIRNEANEGSGCMLAHCMGLGKTFQAISLIHTLVSNQDITKVKKVLVICPKNVLLNWMDELDMWQNKIKGDKIHCYILDESVKQNEKYSLLKKWEAKSGVLIVGYEMLCSTIQNALPNEKQFIQEQLIDPGADLVICDEGHRLKKDATILSQKLHSITTKRRIILSGTPVQNRLKELYCMMQFVKPNLFGTLEEFNNQFAHPIQNGQFSNSLDHDVRLMKERACVLRYCLRDCLQRFDYCYLKPLLPNKYEYTIHLHLSPLQIKLYQHYTDKMYRHNAIKLFQKYHSDIQYVVSHPKVMDLKVQRNKLKDEKDLWWKKLVNDSDLEDVLHSPKLRFLFNLLEETERTGDKVLVFSQSIDTILTIEKFLSCFSNSTEEKPYPFKFQGKWERDLDYFKLTGDTQSTKRREYIGKFNDSRNKRSRLFLISTKAGGVGINLTGANRVVIFDPSWNPCNDLQCNYRIFRFGQTKTCFIYRLLAAGTLEEKIYNRQVHKQGLAMRVLDDLETLRHFKDEELMQLFTLEVKNDEKQIEVTDDAILCEVLKKQKSIIYNIVEHDLLLLEQPDEKLNEAEQLKARKRFEEEQEKLTATTKKRGPKVGSKRKSPEVLPTPEKSNEDNLEPVASTEQTLQE